MIGGITHCTRQRPQAEQKEGIITLISNSFAGWHCGAIRGCRAWSRDTGPSEAKPGSTRPRRQAQPLTGMCPPQLHPPRQLPCSCDDVFWWPIPWEVDFVTNSLMPQAQTVYPPAPIPSKGPRIFLAGSIEMGAAPDWQQQVIDALSDQSCIFLNPRRKDWDSSWVATIDNPVFVEQVEWELAGQEQADLIAMYLDPQTKAPISLLELGLFAHTHKMVVCCPDGYWRKGNVDVVCRHYDVAQVDSLQELINFMWEHIPQMQ